jgi:hypothetical protein
VTGGARAILLTVKPCVERSETPAERGSSASEASLRGSTREAEAIRVLIGPA